MIPIELSVVVPVYQAEKFLNACVDSILAQTFDSLELILVDDGSTDRGGSICDNYARADSRVRVIHQSNRGVSAARNAGIDAARGGYIGFVDADDTVNAAMYERMYNAAKAADAEIVMCDAVTVYPDGTGEPDTITQLPESGVIARSELTPYLLKETAGSACRCIYKASFLRQHSIKFPAALKFSEDRVFNLDCMGYAGRLCYIKEPLYNRILRSESAVHQFHADYFDTAKKAAALTEQAIRAAWGDDPIYQKVFSEQFVAASIAAVNNYFYKTSTLPRRDKYRAVKALCRDSQLQAALKSHPSGGIRGKWISRRQAVLLCMSAIILNRRHGR